MPNCIENIKPGQIYKIPKVLLRTRNYKITKECDIEAYRGRIYNNINYVPYDTSFMILETRIKNQELEGDAFWIRILGIEMEFMGWTIIWYNNLDDIKCFNDWIRMDNLNV